MSSAFEKGINEMFDREKFKDIIAEKDRMSWADREDDYIMSKLWREMTDLIVNSDEDFNDFLKYMRDEMTENEYGYLSEISDEISQEKPSYAFIEEYKALAKKYPKATKDYQIQDFIEVAEGFVEYKLGPKNK